MPNIGLNFSPTSQNQTQQPGQQASRYGGPSSPVMDAIKILSFRVPTVLGANAPVAPGILAGPGGAQGSGLGNAALIQQWLQRFFGGQLQGGMPGQPGMPMPSGAGTSVVMGSGPSQPPAGGRPSVQLPSAVQQPAMPSPSTPGLPNATTGVDNSYSGPPSA